MEETISRIISELEEFHQFDNPINSQAEPYPLLSESTLLDLQTLLDNTLSRNGSDPTDSLYEELSTKSLSPSSLVRPIASAMDMGSTHLSLLASKVYLSLLLSPNAPVFTLFTPMTFQSLLRSIRRSLKHRTSSQPGPNELSQESHAAPPRKRKCGLKARVSRNRAQNSGINHHQDEEDEFDVRVLFSVLERLELAMSLIHLDRFPDSLKTLVQTVSEIPVMALEVCRNTSIYDKLTGLCRRVLCEVLKPEHGDQGNTAAEVLKSLTPLILRLKSQARTFALGFITNEMMALGKESDGVKMALVNLPKYMVQKAPEKSEPRALAVDSIVEIVKSMELKDHVGFMGYVVKMTGGKTNLRLLSVDLIPVILMSSKYPLDLTLEGEVNDSLGLKCLGALIQRCSDVSAATRARALSNLAQLVVFLSGDNKNRALLKEVMGFGNRGCQMEAGNMNVILRKRCMDEKAAVRKAALLLITKLTTLSGGAFDGVLLKNMGMACSDPLVSIRKAAISALSEAFRTFSDESVTTEWLHSVPRLIADNESSIQEECANLFLELVLDRICRAGSVASTHDRSKVYDSIQGQTLEENTKLSLPEGVLVLLKEICDGEVTPWVKKICTSLGKKKRLRHQVAVSLQNIIRTSESLWLSHSLPIEKWTAPAGAWLLLSEVSAYLAKAVDWEFLHHHWKLLDKHERESDFQSPHAHGGADEMEENVTSISWAKDRVFLLQTISNVSVELPPESAADLAHDLLQRIEDFNMHSTEVNAHVKALRTLCKQKAVQPDEADTLILTWVNQLLSKAAKILEKYISLNSKAKKDGNFVTPPRSGSRKGKRAADSYMLLSQAVSAVYTIGTLVLVCPSAAMGNVIPLLHSMITSGNSDSKLNKLPVSTVSLKDTAPSLYIQAWVTMGKICLADEKLAKRYIPLFVQELGKSDCAALRNNLIVMMADFCVRYTALVDCYIAKITKCLCDPCEIVRRQTFILLSRLLQRDYVKWKGVLFLRFLLSLVDESEKIRQLADFLFGNILKVKAPLLAYNSFVEAIFVLNNCETHNGHSISKDSRAESRLFSIRGNDENSRSKRMHIYVSLLKQMAPEHLLATFAKLCAEILAAASDGMLNIDDLTGQCVLQDAFEVLACKEIRIPTNRGSSESADIEEEGGENGAAAARGRTITQAVRKGLIQNAIPIFIELKRLLESKNSPLIGSLMECLRVLLKDYKNEIDDILVADKQLQKELIYDMQKYESAKAKSLVTEAEKRKSSRFLSPEASKVVASSKHKAQNDSKVASAIADVAAATTARNVLREMNKGTTPPLSSLCVPKLKSRNSGNRSAGDHLHSDVLESLRKRQSFESDEEN